MYPLLMGKKDVITTLVKTTPSGWKLCLRFFADGTVREWPLDSGEHEGWNGTWSAERDVIGKPTATLHVAIGKYHAYYYIRNDNHLGGIEYIGERWNYKDSPKPEFNGESFLHPREGVDVSELMSQLVVLGGRLNGDTTIIGRARRGYIERRMFKTQVALEDREQERATSSRLKLRDARAKQPGYMADLAEAINSFRVREGTYPLELDPHLCESADAKARHMNDHRYYAHVSPDGLGFEPFIEATAFNGYHVSENILHNYECTGIDMFNTWEQSPGHRSNMLGDWTSFGVGSCAHLDYVDPRRIRVLGVTHFGFRYH